MLNLLRQKPSYHWIRGQSCTNN